MSRLFTDKELDYMHNCYKLVDEVLCEVRKGIVQSRYVIEVEDCEVWCNKLEDFIQMPKELQGLWIQSYSDDNTSIQTEERVGTRDPCNYQCEWQRAKEVTTTTYVSA